MMELTCHNQQVQLNTEFPRHFAFFAIFLTPVSL